MSSTTAGLAANRRIALSPRAVAWTGRIGVLVLTAVMAIALCRVHVIVADDVILQNLAASLASGQPLDWYGTQDDFFLRLPLYLATNWLHGTAFGIVLWVTVCDLVLALGAIVAMETVLRRHADRSSAFHLLAYGVVAWYVAPMAASSAVSVQSFDVWTTADSRVAETGLLLLLLAWIARWIDQPVRGAVGVAVRRAVLLALATAVLCWDDQYFLGMGVGGLLLAGLVSALRPSDPRARGGGLLVVGAAVVGAGLSSLALQLSEAVGFHILGGTATSVASPSVLLEHLGGVLRWLAAVFGAYQGSAILPEVVMGAIVGTALMLAALASGVLAAIRAVRERSAIRLLLVAAAIAGLGAYLVTDIGHALGDARYVAPIAALLVVCAPDLIAGLTARWAKAVLAVLCGFGLILSLATNLGVVIGLAGNDGPIGRPYAALVTELRALGVTKAYAEHNLAEVVTYAGARDPLVLSMACADAQPVQRDLWLVNRSDYLVPADSSAIILSASASGEAACLQRWADSLGPPERTVRLDTGETVLVYGEDVGTTLPADGDDLRPMQPDWTELPDGGVGHPGDRRAGGNG